MARMMAMLTTLDFDSHMPTACSLALLLSLGTIAIASSMLPSLHGQSSLMQALLMLLVLLALSGDAKGAALAVVSATMTILALHVPLLMVSATLFVHSRATGTTSPVLLDAYVSCSALVLVTLLIRLDICSTTSSLLLDGHRPSGSFLPVSLEGHSLGS